MRPDIFYSGGFVLPLPPHHRFPMAKYELLRDDRLGRLALSMDGFANRDRMVLDALRGAGVPVVVTMGGGYAVDVADTVAIHRRTVHLAVTGGGTGATALAV